MHSILTNIKNIGCFLKFSVRGDGIAGAVVRGLVLNARLHASMQKKRRPITASPPAMSRVTLLIHELCQCFDEQFEELLGRQRV